MTGIGLDRIAAIVLGAVATATVRTVVLAVLAAGMLALWRGVSSARRSFVWSAVLWASMLLPVLVVLPPAKVVAPAAVPVVSSALAEVSAPIEAVRMRAQALLVSSDAMRAESPASVPTPGTNAPRRLSWAGAIFLVYVTGVLWLAGRVVRGWHAARGFRDGAPIATVTVITTVEAHARRLRLGRAPRVVEHPFAAVPMTSGVVRPVIVLPADWREWSDEAMRAVLVHELTHVARRDTLTQTLSHVNRALAWVNPFSWWLHRTLVDLAEQASDEAALDAGVDQATYAETLLTFARRVSPVSGGPEWAVAMARQNGVATERRIDRVLAWSAGSAGRDGVGGRLTIILGSGIILIATTFVRVDARRPMERLSFASLPVSPAVAAPSGLTTISLPVRAPRTVDHLPVAPAVTLPPVQNAPTPIREGFGAGAYRPGAGITNPVVVRNVDPEYTQAAIARRVQGDVEVEVVILTDGTVGDARLARSLDPTYGLDDAAVRAARQWTFRPATLRGLPVPVVVTLLVSFHLADAKAPAASPSDSYGDPALPLQDEFARGAYWMGTRGLTAPILTVSVVPKYTSQAMRDRIQGDVVVELIVMPDGSVGKTRVMISLDPIDGLDDNALAAAQQYRFKPGLLNGQAVPVLVTMSLNFRLH